MILPRTSGKKPCTARPISALRFLSSADFWQRPFQSGQSKFLSVGAMVALIIFLRERGSAESKKVEAPHRHTGK
ncbi:hypothetical protein F8S09_06915 [Deinococcus sp. SDU3-2]|uniref:Uncharacterized protein n=1 Tax=Deinococcus terrestris TaxID=2651870 RepID=A0A7X1NVY4_9DEIO|nr:DUF6766 family protein [Deinococcus terrestris]MPY66426.1 hypothetical protein [Deinococcus terrestris]